MYSYTECTLLSLVHPKVNGVCMYSCTECTFLFRESTVYVCTVVLSVHSCHWYIGE